MALRVGWLLLIYARPEAFAPLAIGLVGDTSLSLRCVRGRRGASGGHLPTPINIYVSGGVAVCAVGALLFGA